LTLGKREKECWTLAATDSGNGAGRFIGVLIGEGGDEVYALCAQVLLLTTQLLFPE
jgi:hypothetical protein